MNQIKLAHSIWQTYLIANKNSSLRVVDATCGNGHDSLFLSGFENVSLHCIDIQESAINSTKLRLSKQTNPNTEFHHRSHDDLSFIPGPIDLIVYNLGYLPGSNKKIITTKESTASSIKSAIKKLAPGGMISIMIYTGHSGGIDEKAAINDLLRDLKRNLTTSKYVNHLKPTCPELIILH